MKTFLLLLADAAITFSLQQAQGEEKTKLLDAAITFSLQRAQGEEKTKLLTPKGEIFMFAFFSISAFTTDAPAVAAEIPSLLSKLTTNAGQVSNSQLPGKCKQNAQLQLVPKTAQSRITPNSETPCTAC